MQRAQTDTQTAVANIHFASAMPHTKCNKAQHKTDMQMLEKELHNGLMLTKILS